MRSLRRLKRRLVREDGITLVELMVTIALLSVVVSALLATLNSAQTNLGREMSRSSSNDQLRLAEQSLDREARSGNVLYNPAQEIYAGGDVAGGYSLRIWTASNNPSRGGTTDWCDQWRITSGGQLQERRWVPYWSDANDQTQVTKWRIVATGITNRADSIAAFSFPIGATGNLVIARLRANDDSTVNGSGQLVVKAKKGSTVEVQQAISGRNTQFYPTGTHCGAPTPDPSQTNTADGTKVPPY
jgi:type II secretory pathway pseudopilin PulG